MNITLKFYVLNTISSKNYYNESIRFARIVFLPNFNQNLNNTLRECGLSTLRYKLK